MDSLDNNTEINSSYADALGNVDPVAVENFEEGKVELSVPMKYKPKPKTPKHKVDKKPDPLPKGKAVPVFSHQTYVDEDGIEHMVPPTYDKSKMNLPKPKFQKPADMPEVVDAADNVAETEETPSFLQTWQNDAEADKIDNQINQILDNDDPIDLVQSEEAEKPQMSVEQNRSDTSDKNMLSFANAVNKKTQGKGTFSSADLLKNYASQTPVKKENDGLEGDIDVENLDAIIAAHTPVVEEEKVEDLGADEVMSGERQNRAKVAERAAIPALSDEEISADLEKKPESEVFGVKDASNNQDDVKTNVVDEPQSSAMVDGPEMGEADDLSIDDLLSADIDVKPEIEPQTNVAPVAEEEGVFAVEEPVFTPEPEVEIKPQTEPETIVPAEVQAVSNDGVPFPMVEEIKTPQFVPEVDNAPQVEDTKPEALKPVVEEPLSSKEKIENLFGENKFAQEYSLGLAENYKVISARDMPKFLTGDEKVNAIQINVGESDYGWSVTFDNGIVMGISDVRRYQLQFGALPSMNGVVAYGQQKMGFNKIKKIVLYQTPKYFRYTL